MFSNCCILIVELLTSQHAVRLLLLMLCAVWDALYALKCFLYYQHNGIAIMAAYAMTLNLQLPGQMRSQLGTKIWYLKPHA